MSRVRLRTISLVLIAVSLLLTTNTAKAQFDLGNIGPSKGQVVGAAVGAIAAITVIGVVIYFAVREPRVTGCVAAGPDGKLTLQGSGSGDPLYLLENAPTTLQTGQRVKVLGHKKKAANNARLLNVDRIAKVYGSCSPAAVPAHAMLDAPPGMPAVMAP